jgi:pimeloyl-ACP methyl ester carboxylesterase
MSILVGIDGTGKEMMPLSGRNAAYDAAFANSFVRRMCNANPFARYFRGPLALGNGLSEAVDGGVNYIVAMRRLLPDAPILLTGYSRGALGVVGIAERLKILNISVRALMMFDCVDRAVDFDAEIIPNNVENVCHVIRDPAGKSRLSFGNDGMQYRPPTRYIVPVRMFMCTHGGMGGTPWAIPVDKVSTDFIDEGAAEANASFRFEPTVKNFLTNAIPGVGPYRTVQGLRAYHTNITYEQDVRVSGNVWDHVQPFLRTHGF